MVSMAHEILVDLFKNRPSLAAEILTDVLGVPLPAYTEARVISGDLTEIQPAEYRADVVVLLLLDGDIPVRVIIVEVQLDRKERKRFTWPAYVTVARAVHGCPADLLIVAPDPAVAAWYCDLVYHSLNEAARRALDVMMKGYEYQSDFAKKYVAQGRDQGRAEARAGDVLTVLRVRGVVVPEAARERILAEKDLERLERWLERASVATSLAAVIDEPS